jgi:hypothetical protein
LICKPPEKPGILKISFLCLAVKEFISLYIPEAHAYNKNATVERAGGIMDIPKNRMVGSDELQQVLEPLIRRIIREELLNIARKNSNIFSLEADMPLYKDLQEIVQRKKNHKIELFSHEEVWDD